jgi:hypothetical protein
MCVIVFLVAAACRGGDGAATKPEPGSAPAGSGSAAVADPPPRATLAEADVRAVVDAWLAAQNAGDFAAYQALYAARMDGIKRAKGQTWRFDRDGWLADRERMFARPMKVEAKDVTVARLGAVTAEVELIQTFAQGTFSDEGPKHLLIVKEGAALRIAREEMLASRAVVAIGTGSIFLVDRGSGDLYLRTGGDWAWGRGPRDLDLGEPVFVTQDAKRAPADVAAWQGKSIDGYAADGTRCAMQIGDLYLKNGRTPHFGDRHIWLGHAGDDPYSDDQIADDVAGGSPYLLGTLTHDPACKPVFATAGAPPVFFPVTPDVALEQAVVKAFRRLDEYKSIQASYEDFGHNGTWAIPDVRIFGAPGGPRYAWASASEGDGCGDFEGHLWAFWKVTAAGRLVAMPAGFGHWEPVAVFDSDGDGRVEIVATGTGMARLDTFEGYLVEDDAGGLTAEVEITYSYGDCSC